MSGLDEAEYQKLAAAVKQAEKIQENEGSAPNGVISNFIFNVKHRMSVLDEQIDISQEQSKKDKASLTEAAIAQLVSQETRLNSTEKEAYASFLGKDYFTREDINDLNTFYADGGAWDKLSKKGKDEIGIRLEEGLQRGEIEFSDVSKSVQKKHNDWVYEQLTEREIPADNLANVSGEARENFIREYESGNTEAARKVLDQQSSSVSVQHEQKQSATSLSDVAAVAENNEKNDSNKSDTANIKEDNVMNELANLGQSPTSLEMTSSPDLGRS